MMAWYNPGENFTKTSGFGYRINPVTHKPEGHPGIDLGAAEGIDIPAADDGVVLINQCDSDGYGNYVVIQHGSADAIKGYTLYGHMSKSLVEKDQAVTKGLVIGKVGSTGRSTGNHLHFEVRPFISAQEGFWKAKPVDPETFTGFGSTPTVTQQQTNPSTVSNGKSAEQKQEDTNPFGFPIPGKKADQLYSLYTGGKTGFFPIGVNNFWHGGIHFETDSPIVAIYEGRVRAYRFPQKSEAVAYGSKSFKYSHGFVLVQHEYSTPKGNKLTFWSLYMHTLPYELYSPDKKKQMPVIARKKQYVIDVDTLRVRSSMDKASETNILKKTLKKGEKPQLTIMNAEWARLGNEEEYIYYKGNTKEEWVSGEPEFDKVVLCDIRVKKSDLLGYTGISGNDFLADSERMVHFEIFSDDSIKKFVENGTKEGSPEILHITTLNRLKQMEKLYESPDKAEKAQITLKKGTPLKIFQELSTSSKDYLCIAPAKLSDVVQRSWLGDYNPGQKTYPVLQNFYSNVNAVFHGCIGKGQPVIYQYKCDGSGNKLTEETKTEYRYVSVAMTPHYPKRYWAKRDIIGDPKVETITLDKDINELFVNAPDAAKFEKDVEGLIAEESFLLMENCERRNDSQGNQWFKVKVPTTKDVWHFFIEEFGIPSGDQTLEGWISVNYPNNFYSAQPKTWNDWADFSTEIESGAKSSDGFADVADLSQKLKSIVRSMDQSADGEVTRDDLRNALRDKKTAARLARCICKSPSEWHYSDAKYEPLSKRFSSQAQVQAIKSQLKKLSFWDEVQGKIDGFPSSPEVWHVHPLAFIVQMQRIVKELGASEQKISASKTMSKEEFVQAVYQEAKIDEETSKVPAAITTAQAILETGYGKSVPTDIDSNVYSYNLFGIKGAGTAGSVLIWTHEFDPAQNSMVKIKDKFAAYNSYRESIQGRSSFLSKNKRYAQLFETNDPVKWANGLQDAGYATDPDYAKKLINIMEQWSLK